MIRVRWRRRQRPRFCSGEVHSKSGFVDDDNDDHHHGIWQNFIFNVNCIQETDLNFYDDHKLLGVHAIDMPRIGFKTISLCLNRQQL